jgi:hypothetical protein
VQFAESVFDIDTRNGVALIASGVHVEKCARLLVAPEPETPAITTHITILDGVRWGSDATEIPDNGEIIDYSGGTLIVRGCWFWTGTPSETAYRVSLHHHPSRRRLHLRGLPRPRGQSDGALAGVAPGLGARDVALRRCVEAACADTRGVAVPYPLASRPTGARRVPSTRPHPAGPADAPADRWIASAFAWARTARSGRAVAKVVKEKHTLVMREAAGSPRIQLDNDGASTSARDSAGNARSKWVRSIPPTLSNTCSHRQSARGQVAQRPRSRAVRRRRSRAPIWTRRVWWQILSDVV